ncbi:MAG TPA: VCBS repeat-containing protein, partial [Blastocatellia bacterium]|nr:VCBS repeat-containing protein [Blastocatellia bacterium]
MKSLRNSLLIVSVIAILCSGDRFRAGTQQSQAPQRPGRSYSADDLVKRSPVPVRQAPSPVTFTDVTSESRVAFKHEASPTSQKYLLETMGGGVAILDYDNDGRMDLFFTNGARLSDPMPKTAVPDKRDSRYWNRLYRQKPDGTFDDVTDRAGIKGEFYDFGVAVGDYDNDGWVDIYVTGYGANTLYRNNGDGTFRDVTKQTGLAGGGWSTSAGWLDYDRDGRLDLFVARYLDWNFDRGSIYCGEQRQGYRAYCHPDNFGGTTNLLYHQRPDGTFEDVSKASKIADPDGKALGVAVADFDGDGRTDIAVANDSVRQSLYHNLGNGFFEDTALPSGIAYDDNGKTFAGMGIDAADYDNDGRPDLLVTVLSNQTYPLFHNSGDGTFSYETNSMGVGQATLLYTGWGARFLDVDNDGLRDILAAQGHVLDTVEKTSSYLKYKQPLLLLRNTGKDFITISPTAGRIFEMPLSARGLAVGDLNNDGYPEIVIGVLDGPPVILRNNGSRNHWVGFGLAGRKSNRSAIGARLTVTDSSGRKQVFDVTTAGSYL